MSTLTAVVAAVAAFAAGWAGHAFHAHHRAVTECPGCGVPMHCACQDDPHRVLARRRIG